MTVSAPALWVAPYHKRNPGARVRLFCFPYAGGGASMFVRWGRQLAPDIEVCPVQLPGRENRMSETCPKRISDVAALAVDALGPYFDMRFALFGHSLGALIAYEVAQRLWAKGAQPQRLIVSAHRAPQIPLPQDPTWHLPDADFKRRLEELNGTPREVFQDEELLQLVLPLIRADFQLDETYTHRTDYEPLDCPITVFGGVKDAEIPESHLQAWREVTRSGFELRRFDGDHFFINTHTAALIDAVAQALRGRY
jgi:medium-chain acyl-[acyl-carrier-protein] hydrolase